MRGSRWDARDSALSGTAEASDCERAAFLRDRGEGDARVRHQEPEFVMLAAEPGPPSRGQRYLVELRGCSSSRLRSRLSVLRSAGFSRKPSRLFSVSAVTWNLPSSRSCRSANSTWERSSERQALRGEEEEEEEGRAPPRRAHLSLQAADLAGEVPAVQL